jgi:hypothetical protein
MPKRRDYAGAIIWAALVVMVVRYSGAFVASDVGRVTGWLSDALSIGMVISGVGMGVLDVVGTAYITQGWRRNLPARGKPWSNRYKVLTAFLVANAFEAVVILTPYTMSRMMQTDIVTTLTYTPLVIAWAVMVNVAPMLVIGGVIFANPGVVTVRTDAEDAPQKIAPVAPPEIVVVPDAPLSHEDAPPIIEECEDSAYYCDQCGEGFNTSSAKAAHVRWQHANGKHKVKEMQG